MSARRWTYALACLGLFASIIGFACVGDDPGSSNAATPDGGGGADSSSTSDSATGDDSASDAQAAEDADAGPPCDLTKPFANIKPLEGINTGNGEGNGSLSPDELHLFFASNRAAPGSANYDFYTASRPDRQSPFKDVTEIAAIKSGSDDRGGCLSRDGKALFFHSSRSGSYDAYVSRRNTLLDPFPAPTDLGTAVNLTPSVEGGPCPSKDQSQLYFGSDRDGGALYRATASGSGYTNPIQLPAFTGTIAGASVSDPIPTADGLGLYFRNGNEIYLATRAKTTDEFTTAAPVTELNSNSLDQLNWISDDGCRVIFTRGGGGSGDLYEASRPK